MSRTQKEEGTSHYRSGIFDVVNVPARKEESPKNVIVRDDFRDLRDILSRLDQNVEANSRAIRSLTKYLQKGTRGRALSTKQDRVVVEIQVAFLRIIDINTKEQTFSADVFVQAAWQEPSLAKASQSELDELDWDNIWLPRIVIVNIDGNPDNTKQWYSAARGLAGYQYPVLYSRMRVRATFKENLELEEFPVDMQELSLVVATERTDVEVQLVEDRLSLPVANKDTFQDMAQFNLSDAVEVKVVRGDINALDQLGKSPKMSFSCYVGRRPGYFVRIVISLIFLITALLFTGYSISPAEPTGRLKVTLTLLLTVVAYKISLADKLPIIPYPTYLDTYILIQLVFLATQAILSAVLGVVARDLGLPAATEADKYCCAILLALFLTVNLIFFGFLIIKYIQRQRKIKDREDHYLRKKRNYMEQIYEQPSFDSERINGKNPKSRRSPGHATVDVDPGGKDTNYSIKDDANEIVDSSA